MLAFAKKRTSAEVVADSGTEPKKRGKKSKKAVEYDEEEEKFVPEDPVALPDGDPFDSYENFEAGLGDWREPLSGYLKKGGLKSIFKFIKSSYSKEVCFPPSELIFACF